MATVNKDFKIKSGLIVEGTTATVNGYDILTKKQADQDYIINIIGGETLVKSVSGNLNVDNLGNLTVNEEGIYDDFISNGMATTNDISNAISTEVTNRNDAISTAKSEAQLYADGVASDAYNNAVNDAALDATSKANAAQQNAENYAYYLGMNYDASGSAAAAQTAAQTYADTVSANAYQDATIYTDSAISTEVTNRNSAIDSAITNLNLSGTYDALGAADAALADANAYTDGEIAALVDSAPALLDTLNELAAAIADNPNYATDVANLVATKADTTYVDSEISSVDTAAQGYATSAENAAKGYADSLATNYDAAGAATTAYNNAVSYTDGEIASLDTAAQGYATTAENNAKGYADSLAVNYDATGSASTAQQNAENYADNLVNNLTTDDIEEGITNQYFLDSRAKSSAADLLTGASLTNITITGTGAGLTITAENGVADSTTDDLAEGSTNKYFTDSRVLGAIDSSTIMPAVVEINNYRKEEATQQYVGSASTVNVHGFSYPYESAKYLVRVVGWNSGVKHSQMTEILMTTDGNDNIAITEYGTICTDTANLASFSATYVGGQYTLTATTAVNNCEIIAAATLLSWAD